MGTTEKIRAIIYSKPARSAWDRGVKAYALELLDNLEEGIEAGYIADDCTTCAPAMSGALLNGASSWEQYSAGGCSLIYDKDIARRLCTPSELKRTRYGEKNPNPRETWIECQARALHQASWMIWGATVEALEIPPRCERRARHGNA